MKRFKLPLLIVAGLAGLMLLAVGLAFSTGVQTWAVRRAVAGQPGVKIEVGSVAAGLTSAEVRDVRVEQDGVIIVAKDVTATYSATEYLSGKKITVGTVSLRGVEIDARNPTAKAPAVPAQAALAPFAGILNAIRLPGEVRLGRIDVDAKVLLPDGQSATFTLEGGGIAPGQFGTLKWKATFADAKKNAPLATALATGEVKLRTTADLRIDAVEITGEASATGPGIPSDRIHLTLNLAQPAATAGESIVARVDLVRTGAAPEALFNAKVDYAAGKPVMNGAWDLAVRSEQLAAVLAGLGLPEVALAGKGSFTFNLESGAATTSGEITGKLSKLEKFSADLADIGALRLRAAFDGGSGKESAQLAKLEFDVATDDGRKLVVIAAQQKLSFDFKTKRLTPERPGAELARVSLLALPLAWAQPALKPRTITGDVSGVFVVEAELDGSRVNVRALEPLAVRAVTLREGEKTLVDRVTLSVSPRIDYTATRVVAVLEKITVSTPDGDTVAGNVSADVVLGGKAAAVAFAAELNGKLIGLVKPYLPAEAGSLALALNAKGRLDGTVLQLSALKLQVDREGGIVLAAVEALQPLTVETDTQKVRVPDAAKSAARVRWGDIPLAWAEPYVAQSKLSGQLVGGGIEVTLLGGEAIAVRALEPIAARNASVAMNGEELLRGADFSTDLNATWKGGAATVEVKQLELRQGTVSLLKASVAGEITPPTAKTPLRAAGRGQLDADFAALAKQPALAAQLPLIRGTVVVKFDGKAADGVAGKVTISAQNLVAREGALALGSMDLSVDAVLDANNVGPVKNTLIVTKNGRRSDLTLNGKVGLKPGAISFDGRVTGDQINVDDMQAFAALGAPPPPTAASVAKQPTPAPKPAPRVPGPVVTKPVGPVKDTSPVWAGFTGRVELNVKIIKEGTGNTVANLLGVVSVRPDRLAAETLSFQLNGNAFKAATILTFDAKLARPYALVGTFDVPGFDVGGYLRKADPSVPAALETTITIASKFNGTAATLPEFADRVMGQFELKGSKGVLRALNKKAETASAITGLLGLAAGLAGQGKLADGLAGASELAGMLKDVPFDAITIQVDRGADAAVVVRSIELLSPMMRLTGSGRVESKPGAPFASSPLRLELQLAAKNELANGLNKARQLSGKTDAKGYYLMATPFTLAGTVEKPDSSDFWKNLTLNTGANFLR